MSDCCATGNSRSDDSYDLAVVGAGSAGFSAAISAAEQGAQVALFGHGMIGGTCVNVGCVPSKIMIRAMEAVHQARVASRFSGIVGDAKISDWRALVAQKDALVSDLRQAKYIDVLPEYNNVSYFEGQARLADGGVTFNGGTVKAGKTIVATGSRADVPSIPGIENVSLLTSTEALALQDPPKSLLVIGGGYIGCELAQIFARAGTQVTIVCRSRLLPGSEPEISQALTEVFRNESIDVIDGVLYRFIAKRDGYTALSVESAGVCREITADAVLAASGRTPNTDGLGLSQAGVELSGNGGIKVDDRMRTSREGTYAAGDVTGTDQFVYMAAYGARIAAENALNGDSHVYDATAMPTVTFTDPQVAGVGLTEAEAAARGISVKTSVLGLEHVPRALAARDTRGLIKLIADAESDRLIGAHIMAPEGADSIQTAVLAIKAKMTVKDLASTIFPYLTTVEGLKLAAQTFDKDVSKLSCCAG